MNKPLLNLTAADLMSRNLTLVPQDMSLQGAARLLSRAQVSGAPVVNASGQCVGVLSTTDFLHCFEADDPRSQPKKNSHDLCQAWQLFTNDRSPTDTVAGHMTTNPVVVADSATVGELAQMMIDAHIHRVVVVDRHERPIGIVTTTDILAAVARETQSGDRFEHGGREFLSHQMG